MKDNVFIDNSRNQALFSCFYWSFFDSSSGSPASSANATTMYEIKTRFAANAADPPLTNELSKIYWHVKNVTNGKITIAAVKNISFCTTELKLG